MSNLEWTASSPSVGISHGAVYASDGRVYVWSGITAIADTSVQEGAKQYLDGQVQTISKPEGEYSATIKAYTYPEVLDGDPRFVGLTYRTGSAIHLVYSPLVLSTGAQSWDTDSDSPSLVDFEFSVSARVSPGSSVSHIVVDRERANPSAVSELENLLYGTDSEDPSWPSIAWVVESFEALTILRIVDHGDGTWTAIGPPEAIKMVSPTEFEISWPSAKPIDSVSYTISSL